MGGKGVSQAKMGEAMNTDFQSDWSECKFEGLFLIRSFFHLNSFYS